MNIVMKPLVKGEKPANVRKRVEAVCRVLEAEGFSADVRSGRGTEGIEVIGVLGDIESEQAEPLMHKLRAMPGVVSVQRISAEYKVVSRERRPQNTEIPVNGVRVGGKQILVIAGPCAVESNGQLEQTAAAVKEYGAMALRAGAYKPRTSPYSNQGLRDFGVMLFAGVRKKFGLPIVTEVTRIDQIPYLYDKVDVLQVGMRNMQNFELLRELAKIDKPVLLKRNIAASLKELLLAAEYVARRNPQVMLCLRGILGIQGLETRAQADLDAIPQLKAKTHLPVIFDPSHAAGRADLVAPLSLAAIAAGADGLLVEVHPNPPEAISDNEQQLTFAQFGELMAGVKAVAAAVGRTV